MYENFSASIGLDFKVAPVDYTDLKRFI